MFDVVYVERRGGMIAMSLDPKSLAIAAHCERDWPISACWGSPAFRSKFLNICSRPIRDDWILNLSQAVRRRFPQRFFQRNFNIISGFHTIVLEALL
jgi:hypothetical protein